MGLLLICLLLKSLSSDMSVHRNSRWKNKNNKRISYHIKRCTMVMKQLSKPKQLWKTVYVQLLSPNVLFSINPEIHFCCVSLSRVTDYWSWYTPSKKLLWPNFTGWTRCDTSHHQHCRCGKPQETEGNGLPSGEASHTEGRDRVPTTDHAWRPPPFFWCD